MTTAKGGGKDRSVKWKQTERKTCKTESSQEQFARKSKITKAIQDVTADKYIGGPKPTHAATPCRHTPESDNTTAANKRKAPCGAAIRAKCRPRIEAGEKPNPKTGRGLLMVARFEGHTKS